MWGSCPSLCLIFVFCSPFFLSFPYLLSLGMTIVSYSSCCRVCWAAFLSTGVRCFFFFSYSLFPSFFGLSYWDKPSWVLLVEQREDMIDISWIFHFSYSSNFLIYLFRFIFVPLFAFFMGAQTLWMDRFSWKEGVLERPGEAKGGC